MKKGEKIERLRDKDRVRKRKKCYNERGVKELKGVREKRESERERKRECEREREREIDARKRN